jgi:hypothetical protein
MTVADQPRTSAGYRRFWTIFCARSRVAAIGSMAEPQQRRNAVLPFFTSWKKHSGRFAPSAIGPMAATALRAKAGYSDDGYAISKTA